MRAIKEQKRERRHQRIRSKVEGDSARPRLSVYRSNKYIYAQIIDDEKGMTLVAANDSTLASEKGKKKEAKTIRAKAVGDTLAKLAKEKKITKVVFDRGGFLYAGRVKALAEALREGGLEF